MNTRNGDAIRVRAWAEDVIAPENMERSQLVSIARAAIRVLDQLEAMASESAGNLMCPHCMAEGSHEAWVDDGERTGGE